MDALQGVGCLLLMLLIRRDVGSAEDDAGDVPVLLWWTPFSGDSGTVRDCGSVRCLVTDDRSYATHRRLGALLFYGSDLQPWDLPLPRVQHVLWGVLHEESPKNAPIFCHDDCITLFNVTSTFRSGSDVPLTLQHLESLRALTSTDLLVPAKQKVASSRAPLVYLASGCDNPLQRDEFVRELMGYIAVDSYGSCLNNRRLPAALADPTEFDSPALHALLAPYRFALALENAACNDYITEKLWRPLRLGVVPVYHGAPNVRQWLPNNDSALLVAEFESPRALAEHLHALGADATAYSAHLRHKTGQVDNRQLREALAARLWTVNQQADRLNFVEAFQCHVCELVWRRRSDAPPRTADSSHYGCPRPEPMLAGRDRSWWAEQWDHAASEARVMRRLVLDGRPVSRDQFYERVLRLLNGRDEL